MRKIISIQKRRHWKHHIKLYWRVWYGKKWFYYDTQNFRSGRITTVRMQRVPHTARWGKDMVK